MAIVFHVFFTTSCRLPIGSIFSNPGTLLAYEIRAEHISEMVKEVTRNL